MKNGETQKDWQRSEKRLYTHSLFIQPKAEYIMRETGLKEDKCGFKISVKNINNLCYANYIIVVAENANNLKVLVINVK